MARVNTHHLDVMSTVSRREFKLRLRAIMRSLRGTRTQEKVALALDVAKDTYAKWEQRGALPNEYFRRFAAIFDLSVDQFLAHRPDQAEAERTPQRGRPRRRADSKTQTAA